MNDNKFIVMDVKGSLHKDSDYITQIMDITGKIKKQSDIFKILPFIMEKVEIIKKTKQNISSEELNIEEDDYGDPIIYIPEEVYSELNWEVGEVLNYSIDENTLKLLKDD